MTLAANLPSDPLGYRFAGPAGWLPSGTRVGSTDYAYTHVQLYKADGTVLIGQQAMASSIPVALASDQSALPMHAGGTPTAGTKSLTTTAAAALSASQACKQVLVQNLPANTVDVLIGDSSSQTIRLRPGDSIVLPVSNVNLIYGANASSTTQSVAWLSVN